MNHHRNLSFIILSVIAFTCSLCVGDQLKLIGISTTPHLQSDEMRYRRPPDHSLGARTELFVIHPSDEPISFGKDAPILIRGKTPEHWMESDEWAWHDFPGSSSGESYLLPPGAMTVWSFNGKRAPWGVNTTAEIQFLSESHPFKIQSPHSWISAVTFLGNDDAITPDEFVLHIANQSGASLSLKACRLWLPSKQADFRVFHPQTWMSDLESFPENGWIPAGEKGGARIRVKALPLNYAVVEVQLEDRQGKSTSIWSHLRIKKEQFDISGGWVASGLPKGGNTLHQESYLKTLKRMHINAGMHDHVEGYTDQKSLFDKYPLKYMNRCRPFENYDNDLVLPRVHAVEFLGEPQYGGGKPVPPMEVWRALSEYRTTRLPTSVTLSEERNWRFYAGLSDYPHYDAYRVCAPAADSWRSYDRWGGDRIRWGAPLETIGVMTRSLRELNRPRPIAYWSQGAHSGWRSFSRSRTSPTPDELKSQAYHGVSSRITSLYWFNLSLKSLMKFPDLIDPITQINREVRMLEEFLLEGDAFEYRRVLDGDKPSWDLSSITGSQVGVFFALDLAYEPDPQERVFRFQARKGTFKYALPAYLSRIKEVFRLDAHGVHPVEATIESDHLIIQDEVDVGAIYMGSPIPGFKERMNDKHLELLEYENSFDFDPANRQKDLDALKRLLD